jgi:TRAP-type C4-dicarboxylate transport system substrate-binding protein
MVALTLVSPRQGHAKSVELSFAMHIPPKAAPYPKAFLPWSKEIEKQTDGRVTFKFYLSQTLVKARDAYKGVKMGIADITWVATSLTRGQFPLSSVLELPYMSPDTYIGSHAINDLYKKFPEIRAEFKDVHVLFLWVSLPYEIHTNKPVRKPQDIKGMKLATQPGAVAALTALGAVPVTMHPAKMYLSVEKGVADGAALAWGAYKAFRLYEVTKYHISPHLAGVVYCTIMNKDKWNSLSRQDQEIITSITSKMMPDKLCDAVNNDMNEGIKITKKRGHKIKNITRKEFSKWQKSGKPAWQKWVNQMKGKGLPGQKVLDEANKLVKKYSRKYKQ